MRIMSRRPILLAAYIFLLVTALLLVSCSKGGGGGSGSSSENTNIGNNNTDTTSASETLGAQGGTVTISSPTSTIAGAKVDIPNGALDANTTIAIKEVAVPTAFPYSNTTNKVIELTPDGAQFNQPVYVTVPYDPAGVADESSLRVYSYSSASHYWEPLQTENIDTVNNLITVKTTHFCELTAQEAQDYFSWDLLQYGDKTLAARLNLKTKFFNRPLPFMSPLVQLVCGSDCGTPIYTYRDLLNKYPEDIRFKFEVTLMQKDSLLYFDQTLKTTTIMFREYLAGGSVYDVEAFEMHGTTATSLIKSGEFGGLDRLLDWYSGNPVLFRFGTSKVDNAEYYLKIKFMVEQNGETYDNSTFEYSYENSAFAPFTDAEAVDRYHDGRVDAYEPNGGDTTPPTVPKNLHVLTKTPTTISLAWDMSPETDTAGYRIYSAGSQTYIEQGSSTTVRITGLSLGTPYCYQVSAYDRYQESEKSTQVCATTSADTTAPSVPTGLTATTISDSKIRLSWTASTDDVGVKGYYIYQDSSNSPKKSATGTAVEVDSLANSTQFCFTVSAFDTANESSKSTQACATTQTDNRPPAPPTNLAAAAVSPTEIRLTWTPSTDPSGIRNYDVWRTKLNGANSPAVLGFASGSSRTIYNLQPGANYCFNLRPYDNAGNIGTYSAEACATTPAVYSISGTITSSSTGISGVTVSLSGASSASTTTDASGNYSFTGLASGSYTITPTLANYSFSPTNLAVAVSGADVAGKNFIATGSGSVIIHF